MAEFAHEDRRRSAGSAARPAVSSFADRRPDARSAPHVAMHRSPAATAIAQLSAALNRRPRATAQRAAGGQSAETVQRVIDGTVDRAEVNRQLTGKLPPPVMRVRIRAAESSFDVLDSVQAVVAFCLTEPETMEQRDRRILGTAVVAKVALDQQQLSVHEGHLQLGVFKPVVDERHKPGTTWELANVPTARSTQRFSFHVHPSSHGTHWIPGAEMHGGHQNAGRQTPDAIVAWLDANHPFQG
jgi:hypothetical protein